MTRQEVLKTIYKKGRLVNMADVKFLDSPQGPTDIHLWMYQRTFPESERKKMNRIEVEIPLKCGCTLIERLDVLSHDTLLRPIYGKKVTVQSEATKGTQYVGFKRALYCTEHNNQVPKNNKLAVEKIKNIIRLNFPERLTNDDVDDLYNFLESRRR